MSNRDNCPRAYGYCRISPAGENKNDIRPQVASIKAYFRGRLRPTHQWGGWVKDRISGGVHFENRPGGFKLTTTLERGDVVVFAKVDRAFRDFLDLVTTCHKWESMGISAHFVDLNLDTQSEMGRLLLYLLGI